MHFHPLDSGFLAILARLLGILGLLTSATANAAEPDRTPSILRGSGLGFGEFERNNNDYLAFCRQTNLDWNGDHSLQPASYFAEARNVRDGAKALNDAIDGANEREIAQKVRTYMGALGSINLRHSSAQDALGDHDYSLRYFFSFYDEKNIGTLRLEYLASLANVLLAKAFLKARAKGLFRGRDDDISALAQAAFNAVDPACHPTRWCLALDTYVESTQFSGLASLHSNLAEHQRIARPVCDAIQKKGGNPDGD